MFNLIGKIVIFTIIAYVASYWGHVNGAQHFGDRSQAKEVGFFTGLTNETKSMLQGISQEEKKPLTVKEKTKEIIDILVE